MGNASHGVLERLRLDPRFDLGYHYSPLVEAVIDLTKGTAAMPARDQESVAGEPAGAYQGAPHQHAMVTKEFGIRRDPALVEALINMADELHATVKVISAAPHVISPVYWRSSDPHSAGDGSIGAAIEHIYHRGETPIIVIGQPVIQPDRRIHVHLT